VAVLWQQIQYGAEIINATEKLDWNMRPVRLKKESSHLSHSFLIRDICVIRGSIRGETQFCR
jgi:hypothetical protein